MARKDIEWIQNVLSIVTKIREADEKANYGFMKLRKKRSSAEDQVLQLTEVLNRERKEHLGEIKKLRAEYSKSNNESVQQMEKLFQMIENQAKKYEEEIMAANTANEKARTDFNNLWDKLTLERDENNAKLADLRREGMATIARIQADLKAQAAADREEQLKEIARLMDRSTTDMRIIEEGRDKNRALSSEIELMMINQENERSMFSDQIVNVISEDSKTIANIIVSDEEKQEAAVSDVIEWGTEMIKYISQENDRLAADERHKMEDMIVLLSSILSDLETRNRNIDRIAKHEQRRHEQLSKRIGDAKSYVGKYKDDAYKSLSRHRMFGLFLMRKVDGTVAERSSLFSETQQRNLTNALHVKGHNDLGNGLRNAISHA